MPPVWPCRKLGTEGLPRPGGAGNLRPVELIVLGSGSNGNTALVRAGRGGILLDAGLGARKTLQRLAAHGIDPAEIDAVLLTHEHGDHAGGLPVLLRSLRCPVYATRLTADEVRGHDPRNAAADWRIFATGSSFTLGPFEVTAFSVPHDAHDPVGFTLRTISASLALLTDLGHVNHSVVHHVTGVDCLFIEANHDEHMLQADTKRPFSIKQRILSPHGHLSNRAAAELAARARTPRLQRVVLGHLSRDCNEPTLAVETVRGMLESTVTVVAAAQDEVTVVPGIGD
jgi:phosphoribosyl 1,2-cyclic phosphodiesterase